MAEIGTACPVAVAYLNKNHKHSWIRSKFSELSKVEYVCNNIAESFNNWIKDTKGLQLDDLIDKIRQMIMVRMSSRKIIADRLQGNILPSVVKALHAKSRGLRYEIFRSGDNAEEKKGTYGYCFLVPARCGKHFIQAGSRNDFIGNPTLVPRTHPPPFYSLGTRHRRPVRRRPRRLSDELGESLLLGVAEMAILPDDYLTDVTKKGYVKEMEDQGKSQEEVAKAENCRLKGYLSICLSGVTTVYWSGAIATLMEMNKTQPTETFCLVLYLLVSLILMLVGVAAATFPSITPWKMGFAGLGSWQAMMFVLVTFHLATFKLHLKPMYSWISMVISSILVSTFWGICAQDPLVLHVLAKYVVWYSFQIAYGVFQISLFLISWLAKPCNCVKPLTYRVVAMYQATRGYLPVAPPFLPNDFLTDVTKKLYEKDNQGKSKEEVDKAEDDRLKGYLSICVFGLTIMYWSGAVAMLMEIYKTHPTKAYCFVMYFVFCLILMLVGVAAATFPSTSPCKMGFAGLGAWNAMLFIVTTFHLATFKLYLEPIYSLISLIISSILVSIFWGIAAQDPMFVHILAKYVVCGFCYGAYGLYQLGYMVVSGACSAGRKVCDGVNSMRGSLFAPNHANGLGFGL
ncbi:uncharacterized protein LOC133886292 [Phragmites australis]|uniref:uncharacterized protein LOC133886292 n=1 Tax=Phragmites australis TaxID=29695 RepID=UPI002D7727FD|nr:uncharacterized protein LOC133886292 [Phragmites australis]